MQAGRGQVLVPRVLALLTRLLAEVTGGSTWGVGGRWQPLPSKLPSTLSLCLQLRGHPPQQEGRGPQLEDVALHAFLLCEGLFDPYQTWRRQHSG